MNFLSLFKFLCFLFLFTITNCVDRFVETDFERNARQLLFPKNCVLQFAVGLAVPSMLSYRKLATNAGILLNLELPDNLTYFSSPFSRSRKIVHHGLLEKMHNLNGMDGQSCVQKSICQLKEVPFEENDIFQQFLKILFSPKINNTELDCDANYPLCPVSMIDFLTEVYEV